MLFLFSENYATRFMYFNKQVHFLTDKKQFISRLRNQLRNFNSIVHNYLLHSSILYVEERRVLENNV